MSVLSRDQQTLIFQLVLNQTTMAEVLRAWRATDGATLANQILEQAVHERDSDAVECGLHLLHRAGNYAPAESVLVVLAAANWHARHEDVVDALSEIPSPTARDALFAIASSSRAYLDYDDTDTVQVKATWALGHYSDEEAISHLGTLTAHPSSFVQQAAVEQLQRIAREPGTDVLRKLAERALAR